MRAVFACLLPVSLVEVECEINGYDDEQERHDVIPTRYLSEQRPRYRYKDDDGNAFLHNLELHERETR